MSSVSFVEALDMARCVRAAWVGGFQYVVVWQGGVGFNVYSQKNASEWEEVDYFTLSDEQGQPVKRSEANAAMREHFERVADEAGCEVIWS